MSLIDEERINSEVIEFICEELSVKSQKVNNNTRLFHDLGVDGIDAYDLLDNYSLKFNVSLGEFLHHDYFGEEAAFNPFMFFINFFSKSSIVEKKSLTVLDMIEGVKTGILKPEQ